MKLRGARYIKSMELDYRNENEVIIRCACGGCHFYAFSYEAGEEDFNGEPYCVFTIESIAQDYSFWTRLRTGLKYIFKGDRCLYGSFELTTDDCCRIAGLMSKYIERIEKIDVKKCQKIKNG